MSKIIRIKKCFDCPYCFTMFPYQCKQTSRLLSDPLDELPNFCPLEEDTLDKPSETSNPTRA